MAPDDGDRESVNEGSERLGSPQQVDDRSYAVWRQWLSSMASDAEAALAAAIAYRDMDPASRETLLESLEVDAPNVDAPPVALYAPLLSVERDEERRARLIEAIGPDIEQARPRAPHRALKGQDRSGTIYVLVIPLYLDFVQVLACGVRDGVFLWVKHDPIVVFSDAPRDGEAISGVALEATPLRPVLDELALVVVSHRRDRGELPEALEILADLFGLDA